MYGTCTLYKEENISEFRNPDKFPKPGAISLFPAAVRSTDSVWDFRNFVTLLV